MNLFFRIKMFFGFTCCMTTGLYSMQSTILKKPTVYAEVRINKAVCEPVSYYSSSFPILKETNILVSEEIPMIMVQIQGKENEQWYDWTADTPQPIRSFESRERVKFFKYNYMLQLPSRDKKLPNCLPATMLRNAKTGTVLSFTIYGFPVELQCCSSYNSTTFSTPTTLFQEDYNSCMKQFINKPYTELKNLPICLEKQLLEQPDITQNYFIHGKLGRVSMVHFIIDLMNYENNCSKNALLLLCLKNSLQQ